MTIKKAIIPAAGLGTRFLPATKSLAKEMLPLVDKPCIQYLVEEAVKSGITEIIFITAEGKESIEEYFNPSPKLKNHLEKKGQKKALETINKIEKLAKFHYVRQPSPKGDGDAILHAAHLVKNEPFAVLFGDDIYDSSTPALAQLIKQYNKVKAPVIALQKVPRDQTNKYGIIATQGRSTANLHRIKSLVEKPSPSKAPSNLAIIGKYIVTPALLKDLSLARPAKNSELRLIDGMIRHITASNSPIYGYELKGQRFDTGDKLGYLKALTHFALKHKSLSQDYKKYLKSLDFK